MLHAVEVAARQLKVLAHNSELYIFIAEDVAYLTEHLFDAHIRALGFRTEDVKLILNSHAHFDHAGGIRALQRASGARVAASPRGAEAIERGGPVPDDPQAGLGAVMAFPPVKVMQYLRD